MDGFIQTNVLVPIVSNHINLIQVKQNFQCDGN